ncbi:hypothetical protein J2S70_000601 [Trueperella bonasi]|uniref:Lactococcin 972 family bacteriocin n=1 Tax=Trueperella bonasi TaxID=312286 RepID=A0ABT9NF53_9ACTO|nr:hypothetical protein [Trueperella bonasi]MDP9806019.1 hypothetical protein [Trueperella bonasi]
MRRTYRSLTLILLSVLIIFGVAPVSQASTISAGYPVSLLARRSDNTLYSYGGGTTGYLSYGRQVGHGWGGFNYGFQN